MGLSIFILLSALIYQGSHAIECYNCADCQGGLGDVFDCSILASTSCYLTKSLSTGTVSKSCGIESLDLFGLTSGCRTEGDTVFCRCLDNRCNTLDLFSNPTTSLTTTQASASSASESVYCYQCINCGTSAGSLTDCSEITTSRYCYYGEEPNGGVTKSCGSAELDELNLPDGCTSNNGYTFCRCTGSGCNRYPNLVSTATTTMSPATTTAIMRSTSIAVWNADATASTASTTNGVDLSDKWYCYVCIDCESSTGTEIECSFLFDSRTCYYITEPNGEILRSCGTTDLDNYDLPLGCTQANGYTLCKCDESGCNEYPELADGATTTTTAIGNTAAEEWLCYICVDCGEGPGVLQDCSPYSTSKACVLTKSPSGEVSRSCGSPEVDVLIPQDNGCKTTEDGTIVCKCSTGKCNLYPDIPNSNSEPNEPGSSQQNNGAVWAIFNPTMQSGNTFTAASWLILLTSILAVCQCLV